MTRTDYFIKRTIIVQDMGIYVYNVYQSLNFNI